VAEGRRGGGMWREIFFWGDVEGVDRFEATSFEKYSNKMKLVWSKEIEDARFVHFNYTCKPFVHNNILFYAYSGGYKRVIVLQISLINESMSTNYINLRKKELNTSKWHFMSQGHKVYLYVGVLLEIEKNKIAVSNKKYTHEEFKVKTYYDLDNKYLSYNRLSKIECFDKKSHQRLWAVAFQGYLYTDIECRNNKHLIFGTAGKGGGFYCINIASGEVVTQYLNGDASNYTWYKNAIILKDKKGNVQKIHPYSGEILDTLMLKDKLFYAPNLLDQQFIYTTAHNKKTNTARLLCVCMKGFDSGLS
jgi:hypothetical protein